MLSIYQNPFIFNSFLSIYLRSVYRRNLNLLFTEDILNYEVVELCCGTCFFTKKNLFNAKKYIGYDLNKKFVDYLNKKYFVKNKVSFEVINLYKQFPNVSSDYYIMLHGLYHFKNNNLISAIDLLDLMMNKSKKGVFIVEGIKNVFNEGSFFLKHLLAELKNPGTGPQYNSFNKKEIIALLKNINYRNQITFDGRFAYIQILK